MAITFPTTAYQNFAFGNGGTETLTGYSHGGGPIIVAIAARANTVSGVTVGGTALSLLDAEEGNNGVYAYVYTHDNITNGSHNVVVTLSGDTFYGGLQVFSVSGAAATPFSSATSAFSNSSTAPSVTVTVGSGKIAAALIAHMDTTISYTLGSGQTSVRADLGTNGTDDTLEHRMSFSREDATGSVVMDATLGSNTAWAAIGFAIEESGGGGGGGSIAAISSGYHIRGTNR